jgi:hypothetical protein
LPCSPHLSDIFLLPHIKGNINLNFFSFFEAVSYRRCCRRQVDSGWQSLYASFMPPLIHFG